jgi:hypothetical protein
MRSRGPEAAGSGRRLGAEAVGEPGHDVVVRCVVDGEVADVGDLPVLHLLARSAQALHEPSLDVGADQGVVGALDDQQRRVAAFRTTLPWRSTRTMR